MATQQPLALEATAYGQASGWRKGEDLIDALPYIDPLTPDIKKQVEALIEAEMRNSTKRPADYLKELPPLPPAKFEGHPLLQQEYERVRARQPMPPLDITRFRLDPPPQAKRGEVAAWRAALDNANAQLEHQFNRIANLELLLKFGPNAWRAQVQLSGAAAKQMEAQLTETRKQIDALNRERKVQQMTAGMELRRLEDEWANAVRKNLEISMACEKMEAEIRMLRAQLPQEEEPQQQEREQQQDEGGKENGQQQEGDEGEQQEGEDEKQREEGGEGRQGQQRHQVEERKDDGAGEKEEEGKEAGEDDEQQPQQDGQQQMDGVVEEQGQQQQDGRDGDGGGDLANGQHDEAEPMES